MIGHNCYAYCRNNPISRKDVLGMEDDSTNPTGYETTIDDLLKKTTITRSTVTHSDTEFLTYTISIESNLFAGFYTDYLALTSTAKEYSNRVYRIIKNKMEDERRPGEKYWLMSEDHIYAELMVHIEIWFDLKDKNLITDFMKKTREKAKIAELNVDERRFPVRFGMFMFDYLGEGEFYE